MSLSATRSSVGPAARPVLLLLAPLLAGVSLMLTPAATLIGRPVLLPLLRWLCASLGLRRTVLARSLGCPLGCPLGCLRRRSIRACALRAPVRRRCLGWCLRRCRRCIRLRSFGNGSRFCLGFCLRFLLLGWPVGGSRTAVRPGRRLIPRFLSRSLLRSCAVFSAGASGGGVSIVGMLVVMLSLSLAKFPSLPGRSRPRTAAARHIA